MPDNEDKPKPKKKVVKKVVKKNNTRPTNRKVQLDKFSELPESEQQYISHLIKSSIEQARIKKSFEENDLNRLSSMIEEFLSCYVVIGYNFHGEPVNLLSVESQQQADSLGTAVMRFMANSPRRTPPGSQDDLF